MRILVTAGGTEEPIDGVRSICNTSTGTTGSFLARFFHERGAEVFLLHAQRVEPTLTGFEAQSFLSCADLSEKLRHHLGNSDWDAVVHLAAVGDYSVASVEVDGHVKFSPGERKIPSGHEILLRLKPNPKLVDSLRTWSRNPKIRIIAFKLTHEQDSDLRHLSVETLMQRAQPDLIVHNDLSEISRERHRASFFDPAGLLFRTMNKPEMAEKLWEWMTSNRAVTHMESGSQKSGVTARSLNYEN